MNLRMKGAGGLYRSTVGKKALMAVSGVILFGFVFVHMLGNAQVFLPDGPSRLTAYGHALRQTPSLLWIARLTLLVSAIVHVVVAIQLTRIRQLARPIPYQSRAVVQATYASRTMMWSGPILLAFVLFHLMHLTWGNAHPDFVEGDAGHNFIAGFQSWPVVLFYVVAMLALAFHLSHGAWSMFQSVGINHPRYNRALRTFARVMTFVIVAADIAMPIAVVTGIVR